MNKHGVIKNIDERIAKLNAELARLQRKRKRVTANAQPPVTDHAIVRYLERVQGVDIPALKQAILNGAGATVTVIGTGRVPTGKWVLVCKRGAVVTVLGGNHANS